MLDNYFNANAVFDNPFSEYILYATSKLNIILTNFTIDNIIYDVNNSTLDLTYIQLCNYLFNNCNRLTITGTSTRNRYNDVIYSEYNDFDGNNGNSVILLRTIHFTVQYQMQKIYFHDNIVKR